MPSSGNLFFASYRSAIFLTWLPTRSKKYQFLNMVTKLNTDAGNNEILSNLNKVDCGRQCPPSLSMFVQISQNLDELSEL